MGRLTLNVLLSFAQFEREVTGERIRDKIAASKKKGIWMGGVVPLGYRVHERALHIVEEHAALVRELYAGYLRTGAVHALKRDLDERSVVIPERIDGKGKRTGGGAFSRGHLYKLLSNPVYLGEITHKGKRYAGQHEPVIDRATWDAVQAGLVQGAHGGRRQRAGSAALLLGRLFDDRGNAMSPSYAQRGGVRYRYYVSQALLQGRREEAGSRPRVPAPELEALVTARLREVGCTSLSSALDRVVVRDDSVMISTKGAQGQTSGSTHSVQWAPTRGRPRREVLAPDGSNRRPIRAEARARAIEAIALARAWLDEITADEAIDTGVIARREGCSERSVRQRLSLAFLAPGIVEAIVSGTAERGAGLSQLLEPPLAWGEQVLLLPAPFTPASLPARPATAAVSSDAFLTARPRRSRTG
jgi:hypothetical protein